MKVMQQVLIEWGYAILVLILFVILPIVFKA